MKARSGLFKQFSDAIFRRGNIAARQLPNSLEFECRTQFRANKVTKNAIEYAVYPAKRISTAPIFPFGFAATHSLQATRSISLGNPQVRVGNFLFKAVHEKLSI